MAKPAYDSVRFFKDQINKPTAESKKWRLVNRGMLGILAIFGASAVLLFVKPSLAGNMVTLAQVALTSFGGLVAVGLGAIAAIDYKNTASLADTINAPANGKK